MADDDELADLRHTTSAYTRALWLVVILNVSWGLIETAGGFYGDSQALKADALDCFGDGLITFFALIAVTWRPRWRARSALAQGLFLGALGIGVIASTGYRVVVIGNPEAEVMGGFGIVALVVNVAAASILMRHRDGDANVRAVWLFSRNDAIGAVAVVIAGALVAVSRTQWPDLVVAAIMAMLFLQSSWSIVREALEELREGTNSDRPVAH